MKKLILLIFLVAGVKISAQEISIPDSLPIGTEEDMWEYANEQTVRVLFNLKRLASGNPPATSADHSGLWDVVWGKSYPFIPKTDNLDDVVKEFLDYVSKENPLEPGKIHGLTYQYRGEKKYNNGFVWGFEYFEATDSSTFPEEMYSAAKPNLFEYFPILVRNVVDVTIYNRIDDPGDTFYGYVYYTYYANSEVWKSPWVYQNSEYGTHPDGQIEIWTGTVLDRGGEIVLEFKNGVTAAYNLRTGKRIFPSVSITPEQKISQFSVGGKKSSLTPSGVKIEVKNFFSDDYVIIEASSDLKNWSDISNLVPVVNGEAEFTDESPTTTVRFYRIR